MFPEEEFVTNGHLGSHKPAILCLHGGGTNSNIFNIQSIRIQRVLNNRFNFVFLDGPLEGEPGPGVIPVFEGLEPYRRWSIIGSDILPAQTDALLKNAMEEQRRKDGRGFVGVLGFSQGAKTAAGLLLEQQLRERGEGEDGKGKGFGFGVLLNATCPPLTANLTDEEKMELIRIPSLHVVGRDDPWREDGLGLFSTHFEKKSSVLMEFAVGHRLPVLEEDTAKIANEILRMYLESEGTSQMDLSRRDLTTPLQTRLVSW
jgi:predicted esterase